MPCSRAHSSPTQPVPSSRCWIHAIEGSPVAARGPVNLTPAATCIYSVPWCPGLRARARARLPRRREDMQNAFGSVKMDHCIPWERLKSAGTSLTDSDHGYPFSERGLLNRVGCCAGKQFNAGGVHLPCFSASHDFDRIYSIRHHTNLSMCECSLDQLRLTFVRGGYELMERPSQVFRGQSYGYIIV